MFVATLSLMSLDEPSLLYVARASRENGRPTPGTMTTLMLSSTSSHLQSPATAALAASPAPPTMSRLLAPNWTVRRLGASAADIVGRTFVHSR